MLINPQDFVIEIPDLHPASNDYLTFWREMIKRSIEGYWLGGYYMPPSLYFYVNLGTIQLNKGNSNVKTFARPWLRDLEWKVFNYYTAVRGFSGFELDDTHSSNYALLDTTMSDEELSLLYPSTISSTGERKKFVHPYTNLTDYHPVHLGRPLFENPAWNAMIMGSRDTGKSYMAGVGMVLKEWLFDGATEFSVDKLKNPSAVDLTVGAEDSQKSGLLLTKTKLALERLPGSRIINGRFYPSPIAKQYQGSWVVGKHVIAEYDKKYPGGWKKVGSQSMIKHRSFKDNPFADQGARNLIIMLEEIGMFNLLKQVFMNTRDNLQDGDRKIGSLIMMGTGGDMDAGTLDAADMFYNPGAYDILAFDDVWEDRGKIGFFIPAYLSVNRFKNERGFTDEEKAKKYWLAQREKAKTSSKGSQELHKMIQYRPIVPSEMFLAKSATIFPATELRARLAEVRSLKIYDLLEKRVELFFDPESHYNGVNYRIDANLNAINEFPWKEDDTEGAVVLYELPVTMDGVVPQGAYIIGCDPFRDNTQGGESFAAIYVMKTNKYPSTVGHNEIVATYVGRPYMGTSQVNETLYKLSLFYGNAKIYFENAVGNIKDYFEKIKRLDLLASQPTTVLNKKASFNTGPSVVYGYPMSNDKIKWEALQYTRTWLLEERETTEKKIRRNLDLIPDPFLLQQLAAFNLDGNFDGVMALVGCVIGLEETYNLSRSKAEEKVYTELDKQFLSTLVNNKRLFK